ncbi:MAG: hypothetical protein ACTHMX_11575 [Thermomicrobiales bacterium]
MDLTTGQIVVIALRVVVPLAILRWPLAGTVAALLLDAGDVIIVEWFGPGGMGAHYHAIDKVLDLWYLGLAAWTATRWDLRVPRLLALGLFGWRVLGVVLFELVGWRPLLFIFPNLFENWFLFCLAVWKWFPRVDLSRWKPALGWLVVLYIPKLAQEYLLHVAQAQPWDWIKRTIGVGKP